MVEVKVPEARIRRADSYSIFRALLDQSPEPADVTLFSFSVAEVWIRRFMDLKAAGRIRRLTVCANFEIMGRQTTPCMMLDGICDAFYLTNTHAKMLYMEDAGGGTPGWPSRARTSRRTTASRRTLPPTTRTYAGD